MKKILVISVHPDDEILGAGGSLLRHRDCGDEIYWLIITSAENLPGFGEERVKKRKVEIQKVAEQLKVKELKELKLPAARLDPAHTSTIIDGISDLVRRAGPELLYIPWGGDAHSDHRIVFDSLRPFLKAFRYPSIKTVLAMETLSETNEAVMGAHQHFNPNWWNDISLQLNEKISLMKIYEGEMAPLPFPRNQEIIRSQAMLRGSQMGALGAEAFICLLQRN